MAIREQLGVYLLLAVIGVSQGANLDCDFESDFCEWTHGSSVRQWQRHLTQTIIPGTGPDTGNTIPGSNDIYIYLYAGERKNQDGFVESGNCVLLSPGFNTTSGGGCFRFWYHMKGSGIGNLSAAVLGGSSSDEIWSKTGEQGPDWKCAHLSLEQGRKDLKIQMTAWTGLNLQGDIALDDFKYFESNCSGIINVCDHATTLPTSPPPAQSPTPDKPSPTSTTATVVSTTPAEDDITMTILYISIAPIVLLLVASVVAVVVYRNSRSKTPDHENNISTLENNNQTDTVVDHYHYLRDEEVYDVLDDSKMNNDVFTNSPIDDQGISAPAVTINDHQPTTGGPTVLYRAAGSSGRAEIENNITGSYMTMKTRDEDAVPEDCNYVVSIPGPNEIGGSGEEEIGGSGGVDKEDVPRVPGKEGGASEAAHGDGDASEGGRILPPPPCGPTSSYISPVFEND